MSPNKLLVIALVFLTSNAFSQKKQQQVDLDWKIGKQEKLSYLTMMTNIDTSSIDLNFGSFNESFSDSTKTGVDEVKSILKKINESLKSVDLVTTLSNKGSGIIDIAVVANLNKNTQLSLDTLDDVKKEIITRLQTMNQGVVLRGSVYQAGGIHSFWVKSNQKNLISIFFELPTKPVKIGDTWKLDINLISNDQNFDCDSSYKFNEVKLIDIKKVNNENIAVVKYNIVEYVKGVFYTPSRSNNQGEKIETTMKFTHQAIAEFSIEKGRWISYDGLMTLVSSGIMTANQKTKLTLLKV
jgi:hypothetical protein